MNFRIQRTVVAIVVIGAMAAAATPRIAFAWGASGGGGGGGGGKPPPDPCASIDTKIRIASLDSFDFTHLLSKYNLADCDGKGKTKPLRGSVDQTRFDQPLQQYPKPQYVPAPQNVPPQQSYNPPIIVEPPQDEQPAYPLVGSASLQRTQRNQPKAYWEGYVTVNNKTTKLKLSGITSRYQGTVPFNNFPLTDGYNSKKVLGYASGSYTIIGHNLYVQLTAPYNYQWNWAIPRGY